VTLVGSVLISISGAVHAQPSTAAFIYEAGPTCPNRATFLELVRDKLATSQTEAALAPPAQGSVRLYATGSGFTGRLELPGADGTASAREVQGVTCAEVGNALAFVLALSLGAKTESEPATGEVREAVVPTAPAPPESPAAAPSGLPPPIASAEAPSRSPGRPGAPPRSEWRFGAGFLLGARTGLSPHGALVEAAFAEARRVRSGSSGPILRVGFERAETRVDAYGRTDIVWRAGRLEACPFGLRVLPQLDLEPCLGIHAGQINALGSPTGGGAGRQPSNLWLDGSSGFHLEFSALRGLSLDAEGGLLFPLTRYRFALDGQGDPTVYQIPSLSCAGFLGLNARFP